MIVCAGSGGVGKTTVAAAIGVRAAQIGLRTLVLTVDPAKRLATALGMSLENTQGDAVLRDHLVDGVGPAPLHAAVIDSRRIFDRFILDHSKDSEVVARIMKNRLYAQLSTTLAGSQEFTALERLLQATESGRYDLVVLDTPPTKHAVDFLTAPQRINSLFQDAVTRWFMSPSEKPTGFIAGLVSRGTRAALKSLEVLTGGPFVEELIDFFAAIRSVQAVLRDRSEKVQRLLMSDNTGFLVVTSFDAAKLLEARYLQGELSRLNYRLKGVVINRAFPLGVPEELEAPPAAADVRTYEQVLEFFKSFKQYYAYRYDLYQGFSRGLDRTVNVLRIPEYQRDIYGPEDLDALAKVLGSGGMA